MELREVFVHLTADDDEECWKVVLDEILAEVKPGCGALVEIGCCSHWLRPHQTRWKADGGFAWPQGYNPTVHTTNYNALPQFDWSEKIVRGPDGQWLSTDGRGLPHVECRIAVPSRTKRHQQAVVHVLWADAKEKKRHFYGFRKQDDGSWKLTATNSTRVPYTPEAETNEQAPDDNL